MSATQPTSLAPINTDIGSPVSANARLTTILNNFTSSSTVTANPGAGTQIVNAINSSPNLVAQLNAAATLNGNDSSNGLAAIAYSPTGSGASYDPNTRTITVTQSFLSGMSQNDLVWVMGHEGYHAANSDVMHQVDNAYFANVTSAVTGSQDTTSLVNYYRQMHLADEANADLVGNNAVESTLHKAAVTNADLVGLSGTTTYFSGFFGTTSVSGGSTVFTPLAGLTLNSNGSIGNGTGDVNTANTAAESVIQGSAHTSTTGQTYNQFYGSTALNWACDAAASGHNQVVVNLATTKLDDASNGAAGNADPFAGLSAAGFTAGTGHVAGTVNTCNVKDLSSGQQGPFTYSVNTAQLDTFDVVGGTLYAYNYVVPAGQPYANLNAAPGSATVTTALGNVTVTDLAATYFSSPLDSGWTRADKFDFSGLSGNCIYGGNGETLVCASGRSTTVNGSGDSLSYGSNATITVNNSSVDRHPDIGLTISHVSDAITTTGTGGGTITLNGPGETDLWVSNASVQINGNSYADRITGNDTVTLNAGIFSAADGYSDNVSGSGTEYASYGSTNFGANSNVTVVGNDEQTTGSSTDTITFNGLGDIFTGTGATLIPDAFTSLSAIGANTVDLNFSNVFITGDSLSFLNNYSYLTGDTIFGNNNSFSGSGTNNSFVIGGTYDSSSLSYNYNTYFGLTTGDYNTGYGSTSYDIISPDTYYFDPVFSIDDPVVLNLAGAKVATQALTSSSAYFDMQNRGTKVHTGWGTAGEGYLVYDPRETNTVTNEASLVSGFPAMKALDTNHDGILSSLDTTWAHLKVWVDSAGTGTFAAGSLKTMDQINIGSINLNATHVNQNQNNNTILDDSTFTWKTGGTGDIAGVDFDYRAMSVAVAAPKPPPEPCVEVGSFLPDGRRAAEVAEGSALELADEATLQAMPGTVEYSRRRPAEGWRIVTASGISLVCSDSAPIPTPGGLVKAPLLMGHSVAVRKDEGGSTLVGWEPVARVESIGPIEVQHISVGDKCFWAGERAGAYILHHNKIYR